MPRSILGLFAALFSALAQDAPAVAIAGRTIDDVHGEAVQNVRLFLTRGTLNDPLVAKSSSDGKFSFPVPDGHYQMTMEKAGYLPFAPEDLDVRGARVDLGDIVLAAKRTISAKITWSDGEPAVDLMVAARTLREGRIDIRGGLPLTRTDDRGIFEFPGLSPLTRRCVYRVGDAGHAGAARRPIRVRRQPRVGPCSSEEGRGHHQR